MPPALNIEIQAKADATTIANVVDHSNINVAGHDSGTVLAHLVVGPGPPRRRRGALVGGSVQGCRQVVVEPDDDL